MLPFFFGISACQSEKEGSDVPGDADVLSVPEACTECRIDDTYNFSYSATLTVSSVLVQDYSNVDIEWTGLTTSIQGHPVDPFLVDEALLLVFPRLSPSEIMTAFATDSLDQSEIGVYMMCSTTSASCTLDDFGLLGSQPGLSNYFTSAEGTWLCIVRNESTLGAVSMLFLVPDSASEETTAAFSDNAASLEAVVDFQQAQTLVIPEETSWSLDWSQLSATGQGNPLSLHRIDRLELGRYAESLNVLEHRFFDLPELAAEKISLDVDGEMAVDLPPLGGEGQWLVALWCDSCDNPVPPFVGTLLLDN